MKSRYGVAVFLTFLAWTTSGVAEQSTPLDDPYDGGCRECFAYLEFPPVPASAAERVNAMRSVGMPNAQVAVTETRCTNSCEAPADAR